jgi:hypothetical protein
MAWANVRRWPGYCIRHRAYAPRDLEAAGLRDALGIGKPAGAASGGLPSAEDVRISWLTPDSSSLVERGDNFNAQRRVLAQQGSTAIHVRHIVELIITERPPGRPEKGRPGSTVERQTIN